MLEYNYKVSSQTATAGVAPPDWPYRVRVEKKDRSKPLTALPRVHLQTQEGFLMDWTPDLTFTSYANWDWHPRDKNALCLRPGGCSTQSTAWPKCGP